MTARGGKERDPVPPAPRDVPGGHLTLIQPSLFRRRWELAQGGTLLADVRRQGWRRFLLTTTRGETQAVFERRALTLGPLLASPAPDGAHLQEAQPGRGVLDVRLCYRDDDEGVTYPALLDDEGPVALFGDLEGGGFAAEGRVWAADRFLAHGDGAVRALVAAWLILKERPGDFRSRTGSTADGPPA